MDRETWTVLAAYIDAWWPATDFTETHEQAYFDVLQGFDADVVESAIRAQLEEGSQWAPSCAALLVACRVAGKLDDTPTFDQVFEWVEFAKVRFYANSRIALHWLATKHEWAALWVEQYGWSHMRAEQVEHPKYGPVTRERLKQSWQVFVEAQTDRDRTDRALELVGERSLSGAGDLRPIDAVSSLRHVDAGFASGQAQITEGGS